jgi:hypothetical protein
VSTPVRRARMIPGAPPNVAQPDRALWNGQCPICEARVLWAVNRIESGDGSMWHAPLEPEISDPCVPEVNEVYVLVSSTGEAQAIAPAMHRKHVCPPEVVRDLLLRIGGLGYYTAEILAIPCPVRPCGSAPGMLCLTTRREAQPRPHGARVVLSRGEELEDPSF